MLELNDGEASLTRHLSISQLSKTDPGGKLYARGLNAWKEMYRGQMLKA